ncbi:MAG: FAD-binding oxidoreductase [Leptolyngbyaceae bacterium]|nr:FAD-binding oxidoreductase [Leptolyngbyaceae bacterium]
MTRTYAFLEMGMVYDWIVIGNGLTGSAVSYELAANGQTVLLVDRHGSPQGATRFSYGGIAYWSGTTPLLKQLCQESQEQYPQLSAELDYDIQFRELDLVLTVADDDDPAAYTDRCSQYLVAPTQLSIDEALDLEPMLNRSALSGAFTTKHGNVKPEELIAGYNNAFKRLGGAIAIAQVKGFQRQGDRLTGILTDQGTFSGANVLVSNGALARSLLRDSGIHISQCFSHAELIETPPLEHQLRTIVMPMNIQRFALEATAGAPETDALWDEDGHEVVPPILDTGAVQFLDGTIRFGQISRALTDPDAVIDAAQSEQDMRDAVGYVLPELKDVTGTWHRCLVSFCGDRLPLIGPIPSTDGLHIFSGFSNPFAILPPLAKRYAAHVSGDPDDIITRLSPDRPSLKLT